MKKIVLLIAISVCFYMCGTPNKKHIELQNTCDSLNNVIVDLNQQIDELKNGEERLVGLINNSYASGKYILANQYIETLRTRHPESKELIRFGALQSEMSSKILAEQAIIEKQRRDSIRLANIDNLGIWEIGYYVDDFGESTKESYVSTDFYGTFSNSATTNSDLRVRFIIDKESIRIQLYEYARNHPIKGEGFLSFKARDSSGKEYEFKTYNTDSGNNTVTDTNYKFNDKVVRDMLLNGGEIKFTGVANRFGSPSEYKFTIKNADFLENALIKAGILDL